MKSRREFLKSSGRLSGSIWLSSSAIAALVPSTTWALELQKLSSSDGVSILQITRHIFPHESLDDAVYAFVVKDLDALAAADSALATLLEQGVAALHAAAGGDWLKLDREQQLQHVTAIENTAFFEKLRATAVVSLYNNELAYAHFGYEGSSFEHGGYLNRGFNNLDWLPTPPPNASPQVET